MEVVALNDAVGEAAVRAGGDVVNEKSNFDLRPSANAVEEEAWAGGAAKSENLLSEVDDVEEGEVSGRPDDNEDLASEVDGAEEGRPGEEEKENVVPKGDAEAVEGAKGNENLVLEVCAPE